MPSITQILNKPEHPYGLNHEHEDFSLDEVTIQEFINTDLPPNQRPLIPSAAMPHHHPEFHNCHSTLAKLPGTITFSIALLVLLSFAGYFLVTLLRQVLREPEDEDIEAARTEVPTIRIIITGDKHPEKIEYTYGLNSGNIGLRENTLV